MRWRLLAPNLLTLANIAAGFLAVLAAAEARYETSVHLLLAAILLDLADGRLARRLGATSRFGQELDSFCDALSFGAAPAFLAYRACLAPLGAAGVVAALAYLLGAVLRLARFNLTSDVHGKAKHTLGVPTPVGAGYVMALVLMRGEVPAAAAGGVVVALALLLVSRLRLPELTGRGFIPAALLVGIGNYLAVILWPGWRTILWWNLWNGIILLADRLAAGAARRRAPAV